MSLDVVIVRHGETDYNLTNTIQGQTDIPLNENGIKQAFLVAEHLKGEKFTYAYSSDLSRAMMTAKTIAPGLEIIADSRLREWHLGDWQGKTVDEINKMSPGGFRAALNDPDAKVPNGESSNELLMRINAFIIRKGRSFSFPMAEPYARCSMYLWDFITLLKNCPRWTILPFADLFTIPITGGWSAGMIQVILPDVN